MMCIFNTIEMQVLKTEEYSCIRNTYNDWM